MDKKYEELRKKLEDQGNLIQILSKIAPQAKLAQMMTESNTLGKTVRVSTYNDALVLKWETVANRIVQKGNMAGEFDVDQRIKITAEKVVDPEEVEEMRKKLEEATEKKHPPTISKYTKLLEEMETGTEDIEMSYLEFATVALKKVPVDVKATKETNNGVFVSFDWNGKEKEIDIKYIN